MDVVEQLNMTVGLTVAVQGAHDDGQRDHNHASAAPHVLHEELLQYYVPQPLRHDAVFVPDERRVRRS